MIAPLSKKTLLLCVLVYIQQFGSENISVENAIILIAFRAIFEKSGGAIAPASPIAAWCLALTERDSEVRPNVRLFLLGVQQFCYNVAFEGPEVCLGELH